MFLSFRHDEAKKFENQEGYVVMWWANFEAFGALSSDLSAPILVQ